MDTKNLPLSGMKVLEFCHTIMGPTCGLVLADLGADVIKIEPTDGDRTRRLAVLPRVFSRASTATTQPCNRHENG